MKKANVVTKGLVILTAASVLCCLPQAKVLADEAQYESTKAFLATLDDNGIVYDYDGMSSNNNEMVSVVFQGECFDELDFEVVFNDSANYYTVYVYDLCTPTADAATIYEIMNNFNADYHFTTFYLDTDNTVSVSCTASLVGVSDIGENVFDTFEWVYALVDDEEVAAALAELQ